MWKTSLERWNLNRVLKDSCQMVKERVSASQRESRAGTGVKTSKSCFSFLPDLEYITGTNS